ncbi:hypothetical protein [Chondromyces crocatus]|uniref:Uncharacterized protein n=1 Tax=Chondromyces crocatus TaxID=52 RepID=A0A0K1EHX1_CHOCO|nr:hypothetical protein [Chondromyces crocatus]AKT40459.1 uncharacterized protein CMC5_046140 [Chondromyces crocatus]
MKRPLLLLFLVALPLVGALLQACGDSGSAGEAGNGGAGAGDGYPCSTFGPHDLERCSIEGISCSYADTACMYSWTCESGAWKTSDQCHTSGGNGGDGGSAGGSGGAAGANGAGGNGGTAGNGG